MADAQSTWGIVNQVLIGYGTSGKVSEKRWDDWVEALKTPEVTRVLNMSEGSLEINSVQRSRAAAVLKERNLKVAVVTDEVLLRGMVTAVSWFIGQNIKAFPSRQVVDAITFLDAAKDQDRILKMIEKLKSELHRS